MMQQYVQMKEQYKDYILMYRLGDFYEMFFDDAIIASKELDIVLTGRDCGMDERAPMCGIPYHSVDGYIARLVQHGYKVSVCEQVKDPVTNDVTHREVVRMITPGTVTDPDMLDESKNNYIVGAFAERGKICLCFVDISTGDMFLSGPYKITDPTVINELGKYSPREIYASKEASGADLIKEYLTASAGCMLTLGEKCETSKELLEKQMGADINSLGLSDNALAVDTAGSLLKYLFDTQLCSLDHIKKLTLTGETSYMQIDLSTWRNLEIVETMRFKEKKGSLLGVLDKTQTAMGARLLRNFLEKPLTDVDRIRARQCAVRDFYENNIERSEIRDLLSGIRDIDRLLTKVVYGSVNPKDIKNLSASFSSLPRIFEILRGGKFGSAYMKDLLHGADELSDITEHINAAVKDEPPIAMKDGGIIREGYDREVDELRILLTDAKRIMANLEASEKEKTGIKTLKVGFNKVFGYYIEVPNGSKDLVPDTYIRKQTLVGGERFITPELKEIEEKLLTAHDDLVDLEYKLFTELVSGVKECVDRIKASSRAVAHIDVLTTLAEVAVKNGYTCPAVNNDNVIDIKDGRHPVVEKMLRNEVFVPNDTLLNSDDCRMAIITGPNMAGKSTYMRSVALITLLAQIGSFVPASSATIGVADKIFTRVGAADDLASGQSTFMVEMNEVAYILKNATKKSLLIFDEIGRGTSTYDGMSIARAVLEHVAEKIKAKSLFATHYHELVALENTLEGVKNFNVAAKKRGNTITFLRKIVPGGTDDSYGIDVARLAGVPDAVIERAQEVLKEIESEQPKIVIERENRSEETDLFSSAASDEIIERLKKLDPTVLTPIEAMNELYSLVQKAKNED